MLHDSLSVSLQTVGFSFGGVNAFVLEQLGGHGLYEVPSLFTVPT